MRQGSEAAGVGTSGGGKADLILLSQNLFQMKPQAIPETKGLATMFSGRC